MATPRVTIDDLPEQAAAEDTNYVIVQDEGITKKMSMATLRNMASNPLTAHIDATVDAHDATAISAVPSGAGVDSATVQGQLSQLTMLVDALPTQAESDTRYVNTTGDTLTGPLYASGAPVVDLEIATKKYVDDTVIASVGGITEMEADARYVNIDGDTMTGPLSCEGGVSAGNLPIANVGQATTDTDALQKGQADLLYALKAELFNLAWPIGSVFISVVPTDPASLLGGGTWVSFAVGRTLFGLNAADTSFDTVEETGGAKTHTLATGNLPGHTHSIDHNHPSVTSGGNSVDHTHTMNHDHAQVATAAAGSHSHSLYYTAYAVSPGAGAWLPLRRQDGGQAVEGTSDSVTHTHTVNLPTFSGNTGINSADHTHAVDVPAFAGSSGSAGSGTAVDHLPPYVVTYMWKRTA